MAAPGAFSLCRSAAAAAAPGGFHAGTGFGQSLLHVGLAHGGFTQTAAQQLILVGELAGDFKQAPDALGQ
ncbi:hypothetical protein V8H18_08365 [Lautropia mirabilis]